MPRAPWSPARGDVLTDAVMSVLCAGGVEGFSMRALAHEMGLSVGALVGRHQNRGRILHVAINTFRLRWLDAIAIRSWESGLHALLPLDDEGLEDVHVWSSFLELSRFDETLRECVEAQREDERALVARLCSVPGVHPGERPSERLDEHALDHVLALVDGLRVAMCAPQPMPAARAIAVLDAALDAALATGLDTSRRQETERRTLGG